MFQLVSTHRALLPTQVWAGWTSQGNAIGFTAFHQKFGADIGRIDKQFSRRQRLVGQSLLNVVRALGFMDRG